MSNLKPALILFSHGSLLCGAGETLREHAERLRATEEYLAVEYGYLNYSLPSFEEAAERCAAAGAVQIVVVPYFLVSGKFVREDLPPRIEAARREHPQIEFILAEPLGFHEEMTAAVLEMAAMARPPEHWRHDMLAAPDFCAHRPDCPLFGSPICPVTAEATGGHP
ncbi:MAG: CbiX/SirB N-terminal domain-containing protein [Candidatus Sumerlaeaceae bacterium]|nr:CbiX/SirB N-terminal domain-containing protein [Candidatus Sumerlaeaceae bacterium]